MRRNLIEKNFDEERAFILRTEQLNQSSELEENHISEFDEESNFYFDEKKIIYTLIYTIMMAECGDRSQISSVLLATVYNFSGVMVGTTIALFSTILLAVFLGGYISKYISEKTLNYVAGLIFLLFGLEIFLTKTGYI